MMLRIIRFRDSETGAPKWGLAEGDSVFEVTGGLPELAAGSFTTRGLRSELSSVQMLAPVAPSKIICVGRNYTEHAAELGNTMPDEPLLFLKPPSAIIGHGETINLPPVSRRVEHEGELAVVIGRTAKALRDDEDPLDYVLGYTCLNDVTARDIQRKDVQFTRGKSFDTFCPVGPHIVTGLDPSALSVETRVNSLRRQFGQTSQMKFPVPYIIRYISQIMTLEVGDLIATGTPAGVGPLAPGDTVEVEVSGIGTLTNRVADRL